MSLFNSLFLLVTATVLCGIAYAVYKGFSYLLKNLKERQLLENKRQKELQESIANISDKNLAAVMDYLLEQQNKQFGFTIFILILVFIVLSKL